MHHDYQWYVCKVTVITRTLNIQPTESGFVSTNCFNKLSILRNDMVQVASSLTTSLAMIDSETLLNSIHLIHC